MASQDQTLSAGTGLPAPADTHPEAIKAIPIRHWGRWVSAVVVIYLVTALIYSFVKSPNIDWPVLGNYLFKPLVVGGAEVTIELTVIAMIVGAVGGTVFAVMRLSVNPVLSAVSWAYIWFFRGTPVYVQIILWGNIGVLYSRFYAGLPFTGLSFGSTPSALFVGHLIVVAILALGLNEAAYAAELVRAGIISVDAGQTEAALSLGMSPTLVMRRIVLPQAMRVIIPTMGNETISMLKNTSLLAVLGGGIEMFGRLQIVYSQTFRIMPLLMVACIWYLAITTALTVGQHYLEAYFGRGFGTKEAASAEKRAERRVARARA